MDKVTVEKMINNLRTEATECSMEIAKLELQVKQLKIQRRRALLAVPQWEKMLKTT